jgi:LmbE family N-acetylglucosaminyl deacetylase
MNRFRRAHKTAAWLAMAAFFSSSTLAQAPAHSTQAKPTAGEPREVAQPIAEDRGAAAMTQALRHLSTWASMMMIVAHPDDEDGAMMTYEGRGQGVRTSQLTLTRGEGGQNAITADIYDELGVIRTNELLRADQFYGVHQYWGTEADFGFSKTREEALAQWGHDRVLYDAVLAIRRERPLVLVATFAGAVSDGHGQHQVSAQIEQEAYKAAGDPKVFPDQFALGLRPWSPRAVFCRMPFASIGPKGIFDYATGKYAPVRFENYVTGKISTTALSEDVKIPAGSYDPVIGLGYGQIAREGWGEQKSQNGGGNPTLSGSSESEYHRWATTVASINNAPHKVEPSFFSGIDATIPGLASLVAEDGKPAPDWLASSLKEIAASVADAETHYDLTHPERIAPILKTGYQKTITLRERVAASDLQKDGRDDLVAELRIKERQFQDALALALGLDLQVYTTRQSNAPQSPFGPSLEETSRSVSPGDALEVRIHTGNATREATLDRVWLQSADGKSWAEEKTTHLHPNSDITSETTIQARVPGDEKPTEPYFTRPTVEQPYYDLSNPAWRGRSFAPYPLSGWAEFHYQGVPILLGETVQTMQRVPGIGGIFEPLIVTPRIGIKVTPEAQILPPDGSALSVRVTVHSEGPAEGKVRLQLPEGWTATPAEAPFHRKVYGDTEPIVFSVQAPTSMEAAEKAKSFVLSAQAESNGRTYTSGWQRVGYAGLRPYNVYHRAESHARAIDVSVAPNLRVAYVMGTGDTVPQAIEGLGIRPHLLTSAELFSSDLSLWDTIVIGIRAYSNRPELGMIESRLESYVENGGTLIVQYQSNTFPAPYPLSMGRIPERVVEEKAPVKILAPNDPLMTTPNQITTHDFDGWVEERGHSFLDSWDSAYTPLTETADEDQAPQRGGLIVAHPGKGTYVYIAYALYRQLPELVPGSYRLLANLLSAGKSATAPQPPTK